MSGLDDALEIVSLKRWKGTAKQISEENGGHPTDKKISERASRLIVDKDAFNGRAMLVRAGWRTEMKKIAETDPSCVIEKVVEVRDGSKA